MEDVLLRSLVSSDPLISSLLKLPAKKMKALLPEAIELLKSPSNDGTSIQTVTRQGTSNDGDDNDDDNDDTDYSIDRDRDRDSM